MIDLGKVLVVNNESPSELAKLPNRVRTDTIYKYALHQIDGTGWRADYAFQALALLQEQDISSYDLSPFEKLRGVRVSDGKIDFNLDEIIEFGYEHVRKNKDTGLSLGILKFAQEQGADINPRRLAGYGLRMLPKDVFHGLYLLAEAKGGGLVENILTPEADWFIPTIVSDKPMSKYEYQAERAKLFTVYLDLEADELARQGNFSTAELFPQLYEELGLPIDEKYFDERMQKVAFSMIEQGNGDGLAYFFPTMGYKGDLLKGKELSKVIEDGHQRLKKGEIEQGGSILYLANIVDKNVTLSEEESHQIKGHLFDKIKGLKNNFMEPFRLKTYAEEIDSLGVVLDSEAVTLKKALLDKLYHFNTKGLLNAQMYLSVCSDYGLTFYDVCEIGYKKIDRGRKKGISEGLEILAKALQKYASDKYVDKTGDILFESFDSRDEVSFKRKIKRELSQRGLDTKILDFSFEHIKEGDYKEGMDNLRNAGYIGIRPNFTERMSPKEMTEVAYRTMETKFMFRDGIKLLRVAVRNGAETEEDVFNYLNRLNRKP